MTNAEMAKSIVEYIVNNAERESIFLSPRPATIVEVSGLLDHVRVLAEVEEAQIAAWFDAEAIRLGR